MILPLPFIERLNLQFGLDESLKFQEAIANDPKSAIRINPKKWKKNIETEKEIPWCSEGFFLAQKPSYTLDPLFHAGSYYPQDASSMFLKEAVNQIFADNKNIKILDLCAAPGGKSTLLASWLNGEGYLVANEVIKHRAQILKENLVKWGYSNVAVTNNDPAHFAKLPSLFDLVVIDAPCSGEGLFRKDNEAITEWSIDNANLCSSRQRRILMDAMKTLKPNGVMIYSTCTFNPEENEKNIEWLATQTQIEVLELKIDPTWGVSEVSCERGKGYGFYPHKVQGEGFFLAAIRNLGGKEVNYRSSKKSKWNDKVSLPANLLNANKPLDFKKINNQVFAFKEEYGAFLETLSDSLYLIHLGICLGEESPKGLLPNHSLALSNEIGDHFPTIELEKLDALKYLKGESNIAIEGKSGWNIITYKQLPLGFVKLIQNRFNNYYPKEYRIRMNIE